MKEVVKIVTMKKKIITLTVDRKTDFHYIGTDKFGQDVIHPIDDIYSLETLEKGDEI